MTERERVLNQIARLWLKPGPEFKLSAKQQAVLNSSTSDETKAAFARVQKKPAS